VGEKGRRIQESGVAGVQELRNGGTEEIDDLQIRPVAPLSLFISFSRHFAYPTPELLKRLTPEF
jgi:hypothetical protein